VLVDPVRARRAFGLEAGETFSANIQYIYRKQLEEADIIVISKRDLLPDAEIDALQAVLRGEFPNAEVLAVSARAETGMDAWFRRMMFAEQQSRPVMAVDYDRYADGEARLGWLNASATAVARTAADGNTLLQRLAADLQGRLAECGAMIAHLKMTLHAGDGIAAINVVRDDLVPELGVQLREPVMAGDLVVNLRAEAAPDLLEAVLRDSLGATGLAMRNWRIDLVHAEAFRPGRPEPTHRDGAMPPNT
jgi:hypothetical protein